MRKLLIGCLLSLVISTVTAQHTKQFLIRAGEIPEKTIPLSEIYFLPSFSNGIATLKNNATSRQQFNYNCLLDELQFLSPIGDTMAIAEPALLRKVVIDSLVYYYDRGYLRQLISSNKFTLAIKERIIPADTKKQAAYGATSGTSAIDNYSNIYSGGRAFKLESRQEMLLKKESYCFLGNVYDHFVRADKKGFFELFPDKRAALTAYIKQEKISFNDLDDIKKVFLFCTTD